jgi:hypothetical protein
MYHGSRFFPDDYLLADDKRLELLLHQHMTGCHYLGASRSVTLIDVAMKPFLVPLYVQGHEVTRTNIGQLDFPIPERSGEVLEFATDAVHPERRTVRGVMPRATSSAASRFPSPDLFQLRRIGPDSHLYPEICGKRLSCL